MGGGSFHEQYPRLGAKRFLGDIVSERKIIHSALADLCYANRLMRCEQLQRNSHGCVHNQHPTADQQTFREHSLRRVLDTKNPSGTDKSMSISRAHRKAQVPRRSRAQSSADSHADCGQAALRANYRGTRSVCAALHREQARRWLYWDRDDLSVMTCVCRFWAAWKMWGISTEGE